MRGHAFVSTSLNIPGIRPTLHTSESYQSISTGSSSAIVPPTLWNVESEGHYGEDSEPCQTMDAEGEGGHRDIPEPCSTMLTFVMQFSNLLDLILRLRCHAVTLPTYDTCM